MNYNQSQLAAIRHFEGPALILAGPGSGKTAVVTERVRTLIETHQVSPSNILVITFTRAAANEMKERFFHKMKRQGIPVSFGTFHGVYFTILKHAYHYGAENIISEEEQFTVLRRIVSRMELECENEKELLAGLLAEISRVKGDMLELETYYPVSCGKEVFHEIYEQYDKALKKSRKIDFDDMILYCYELLSQRDDILKAWQNKYQYILIDEFQDINRMQYQVIRLLAGPQDNLFVVGDDDQSIYGFRGAKPDIMLNFTKDYKTAKVITLDVNYRCQKNIVTDAIRLINHNKNRFPKDIRAENDAAEPVQIKDYPDVFEEAADIVSRIRRFAQEGMPYSEMAVLTRTNEGGRFLVGKLMEYGIPFRTRDKIPSIYSHWIAKNIIAYINMALGNRERSLFLQIMNKPKRYISRDVLTSPVVNFDDIRAEYQNSRAWMLERIDRLEEDLQMISGLNPYGAINYIRRGVGYDDFLNEYALEADMQSEELFDVLNELQEAAREFDTFAQWFLHIEQYEQALAKENKNRGSKENGEDAVNIVTMHCAKGLEYEAVFVIDVNEGIMPYKKAVLDNDIEEERRMLYVAMTRAKTHLHLSYVKNRFNKEMELSRFIHEIRGDD